MRSREVVGTVMRRTGLIVLVLLAVQMIWTGWIIRGSGGEISPAEAVVVYGGDADRIPAAFRVASVAGASWVVCSGSGDTDVALARIRRSLHSSVAPDHVRIVSGAYTTDQNARTSVPVLRSLGVRSCVLVTSWYHLPRAYFLTRLYSFGSGISWSFAGSSPCPSGWWKSVPVRAEFVKFWGSLFRVFVHGFGLPTWPRPADQAR